MARSFHANQYENAYNNTRMSSWCVPKAKDRTAKMPKMREGSSYYIADDRGYLKPGVPRSKESPWGTFMGTWDMPHHIPNPYVHTTGRQPEAAKKLLDQVKASPLNHVRNGFVPHPLFPVSHIRNNPNHTVRGGPVLR
ncbi:protein Flattop [Scyliorhinus torazame]|uniref:protein Flattop n=1 Tax=Scyliorhinus torazame TaxID=75743 RepID=UPI003B59D1E2